MWKEVPRTRKKEVLSSHHVESSRQSLTTVSLKRLCVGDNTSCTSCTLSIVIHMLNGTLFFEVATSADASSNHILINIYILFLTLYNDTRAEHMTTILIKHLTHIICDTCTRAEFRKYYESVLSN